LTTRPVIVERYYTHDLRTVSTVEGKIIIKRSL